jgi:hypothetical protein
VGVKTFRRTPVLVNKPDIGVIDGPVQIIEASGFQPGGLDKSG